MKEMRQTPCILTTFVWSLNRKTSISLYIFRYFYKNRRHRHPYFLHLGRKDQKKKRNWDDIVISIILQTPHPAVRIYIADLL